MSLAFFLDSGMTVPLQELSVVAAEGVGAEVDKVVYIGDPMPGREYLNAQSPGVDSVDVEIVDAGYGTVSGAISGTDFKLSTTAAGLDAAVAGGAVSIGVSVLSGVENAVPVFVRIGPLAILKGEYAGISLRVSALVVDNV